MVAKRTNVNYKGPMKIKGAEERREFWKSFHDEWRKGGSIKRGVNECEANRREVRAQQSRINAAKEDRKSGLLKPHHSFVCVLTR